MNLIQTVEDSFFMLERFGMRREENGPRFSYRYPSLPQKGGIDVLGDINRYYFIQAKYHILKDSAQQYKMDEPYIEFGEVKESRNFITADKPDDKPMAPKPGFVFMVVRPTGAAGCIYVNSETYCCANSVVLRHSFCKEHLFPVVRRVWGNNVDEYAILQMAGNNCLPVWADIISALNRCAYAGVAAQLYLDGKASEILAALTYEVEHLEKRKIRSFTVYEREAVSKAQNMLRRQVKNPPSLKKLSRELGLNQNKMQAVFKHYTGVTVMEYLRGYRMEKALELLKDNQPLKEIAFEVGYKSASRFSETFYKTYGLLPSKYKKFVRI
jgi:AraC-like DNA-binding protein